MASPILELRLRFSIWRSTRAHMRALRERAPDLIIAEGVILRGADRLTVGRGVLFDVGAYLNAAWMNGKRGYIEIGDNVEIGPYASLWGQGGIKIGSDVHIGSHVSITGHEARQVDPNVEDPFEPLIFDTDPVIIEDHVLICSGCVIAPGVRIGHHAMIGGGSLISKDIPPYAFAVGNPARVIKILTPRDRQSPEETQTPAPA